MKSLLSELPTPFELLMDPLSLAVLASYLVLIIWEEVFPARKLPKVKYWRLKGLFFFFTFFFVASYLPIFIDPFLLEFQLFNLDHLGVFTSSLIGLVVYEVVMYAYHYTMHKFDFLWRTFHQVHHSAERLDAYGSLFHSPLDMIGFTLVGSVSFTLLIGLPSQSVTILLFVAWLIKAPFFFVAVGSQANVGGAASAPIVASAFDSSLAPVGVLMAVLGYALGTYGAIICATLMQIVATG